MRKRRWVRDTGKAWPDRIANPATTRISQGSRDLTVVIGRIWSVFSTPMRMMHFQSSSRQRELIALARRLARERFAPRADRHDRAASFPFDDYADLRTEGLLGLCVHERYGGLRADYEPRYLSTERWQWRRNRSNGCGEMDSNSRSLTGLPQGAEACLIVVEAMRSGGIALCQLLRRQAVGGLASLVLSPRAARVPSPSPCLLPPPSKLFAVTKV